MKNFRFISFALFILLMLASSAVYSQDKDKVYKDFKKLVRFSRVSNYSKAAGYIVYRGDDASRKWRDICDYENGNMDEKKYVEQVVGEIRSGFRADTDFELISYNEETESEGTWHILKIKLFDGGKASYFYFAFLKIKGHYALGDIDESSD